MGDQRAEARPSLPESSRTPRDPILEEESRAIEAKLHIENFFRHQGISAAETVLALSVAATEEKPVAIHYRRNPDDSQELHYMPSYEPNVVYSVYSDHLHEGTGIKYANYNLADDPKFRKNGEKLAGIMRVIAGQAGHFDAASHTSQVVAA